MGIGRKLQDVRQDLSPLEEQGKVEGFFNNVENAGKLGSLVEGIRDVIMEYQVCTSSYSFALYLTFVLDFIAARDLRQATRYRRQESPTHRESHPLAFRPHGLTDG